MTDRQTDGQTDRHGQTDIPVVYMLATCCTIFSAYLSKLTMTSSVELELKVKKSTEGADATVEFQLAYMHTVYDNTP